MPTLFESTGMPDTILNNTMDLSNLIKTINNEQSYFSEFFANIFSRESSQIQDEQCYFLSNYANYFPQKNQLPLGFVAPVVYLNTTLTKFEDNNLKDINILLNSNSDTQQALVLNGTDVSSFSYSFGNVTSIMTENAKELFISGQAKSYFSDTTDFFDIQNALPARYKLLFINNGKILGYFNNLWSIGKCSANERKAAERLLLFMLSDNAQDYLHIRNHSDALPINKDVLNVFCNVYNDFDGFFINIDDYNFNPQN